MLAARRVVVSMALAALAIAACSQTTQVREVVGETEAVGSDATTAMVYRDPDPAAVGYHAPPGQEASLRRSVEHALIRNPRNVAALTQRAYWRAQEGKPDLAQRDYDDAMAASEGNESNRRRVLWSRGWTRYNEGDISAAFTDWDEAVRLHGGRPYWVPYTYAVAHWTQGDRQRALIWYGAAVASNADWGDEAAMEKRTRHWKDGEKQQLHALFAAWQGSGETASASAH